MNEQTKKTAKKVATGAVAIGAAGMAIGSGVGVAALGTAIAGTYVFGLLGAIIGGLVALAFPQLIPTT